MLLVQVKNKTSSPSISFLFVPHPILYYEVALNYRLHFVESQLQTVPYQLFLQFVVFFEVELQQISWPDDLCPLQGQLSALVAEQHFFQHCLAGLADPLHEPIGYFDLSGEDNVEVLNLIAGLVQLEGRVSHEDAAHLEEADVDDAVVAQEKRIECLQAKNRVGQILLVALFDRSWHQLYNGLEVPAGLLNLFVPQVVL